MNTNKIKALIIDDEAHNRSLLSTLLNRYCPQIEICGEAESVDKAFGLINEIRPGLIFLDVKMPGKNGFDLLRMFDEIFFEVIFVSGFNEYAIHAFEFNALGYILKPIDYTKLISTVQKAEKKLSLIPPNTEMLHFIRSLDEKENLISRISVHHLDKVILLSIAEIISIEAKVDYCRIEMADKSHYASSKDLKLFENMLESASNFIRINKSVIINVNQVKCYSKGEPCIVEMKTGQTFEVSRRKKSEIIAFFKRKIG